MPQPGQRTITVNEEVYLAAEKAAELEDDSVAGWVTKRILEHAKGRKMEAGH